MALLFHMKHSVFIAFGYGAFAPFVPPRSLVFQVFSILLHSILFSYYPIGYPIKSNKKSPEHYAPGGRLGYFRIGYLSR